jgi:hypothetical protein
MTLCESGAAGADGGENGAGRVWLRLGLLVAQGPGRMPQKLMFLLPHLVVSCAQEGEAKF